MSIFDAPTAFRCLLGPDYYCRIGFPLGGIQFPQYGYDFRLMAAERMAHGLDPIDWPKILVNQFEAESRIRQLSIVEKLLYKGALQALNEAQR